MDPLSIAASVAGLLSLCIQIGQTVGTLADALQNVDNTISSFRGEISALSGVLKSISTAFTDPKRHRILEEASHGTGHLGQYWKGVVVSLDHCGATLEKMKVVLDGIETSRRTRIFRSFGKHLKLTSEEGVLTLYRQEVQSYTANLQVSLQMINVCLSLASDDVNADASVRLDELSDDVRNISRQLERIKNDLPTTNPGDKIAFALVSSSQTVVEDLQSCLGAAERLISDASTLAEKQSIRESVVAPTSYLTTTRRRMVQEWINTPTADAISERSLEATTRTASFDNRSIANAHANSPLVDRFRPGLPVHNEEEEGEGEEESSLDGNSGSESSDIDSGFKMNLFQAGLQYFEQFDYALAEKFFTKAVQASVEGEKSQPADGALPKIKFYLAQTMSKQRRWADALVLLLALQKTLGTLDNSLKWMESSIFHELALVYFGQGLLEEARLCAKSASEKRKKMYGKKDPRFRSSVGLLADICQSQNDPEAAEGYRRFIPKETWSLFTCIHKVIPEGGLDDKEFIAIRTTLVDNEIDDSFEEPGPPNSISRSNSSQLSQSNAVSRSTSFMSGTATGSLTQYSFDTPSPRAATRPVIDCYIPPRMDAVELDATPTTTFVQGSQTQPEIKLKSDNEGQKPYVKEFLKTFREVGQNQMVGLKDKAAKLAMAYYRSFDAESLKFKHITRYMNDAAWRSMEKNIVEGLASLSSTGHGFSAIHFFAMLGIPSIVELLLDRRADVSAKAGPILAYTQPPTENKRGRLGGLARSLSRGSMSNIASIPPAECNWTPLHFACGYSGDPETIKVLLDRGAQLEEKVGKSYTPLLVATRKAALDMDRFLNHATDLPAIKILVDYGAKVDAVDADGLGIHAHAHCMVTEDLAGYLLSLSAD